MYINNREITLQKYVNNDTSSQVTSSFLLFSKKLDLSNQIAELS